MQFWKKTTILAVLVAMLNCGYVYAEQQAVELTLEECVELALDKNAAVKIAEFGVDKARGQLYEARGALLPHIDASHAGNWTREYDQYGNKRSFTNQIGFNWVLFSGGKYEGIIKQSKLQVENADEDYRLARQSTRLNAEEAYYGYLQSINLDELYGESVQRLEAHLENVMAKYRVGMVAKTDVLRSEVELADARQQLIKARNNKEVSMYALNNVINIPMETYVLPKEMLSYELFEQDMQSALLYALEHRPEVLQADTSIDIAKRGVNVAKANYHPTLSANGAQTWQSNDYAGDDDRGWSVGVAVTLNVFDSGVTPAKIMQAKADLLTAEEAARQTKDNVRLEVKTAYLNMLEAEKRIFTSSVAVEKAEEDFRIAKLQYNSGVGTLLDILDSQVSFTQAKTNYVNALYDFNMSKAQLRKAMGIEA